MKWVVVRIDKNTKEEFLDEVFSSEEGAERYCEEWGWNYDDGKKSWWLGIREVNDVEDIR